MVASVDQSMNEVTARQARLVQGWVTVCRQVYNLLVGAVRGILMRECANLYKSMKIGTLVIFDMLCPNLPGAKANSQCCRHIRQFKMAAA